MAVAHELGHAIEYMGRNIPTEGIMTALKQLRDRAVILLESTRYARPRCRIRAGTAWNFIAGFEPDVVTEGKR